MGQSPVGEAAPRLSHVDEHGRPAMVDVGGKDETEREAVAGGRIRMAPAARALALAGELPKGAVEDVARIAGIQAAKRTAELIPMCHPLALTHIDVEVTPEGDDALAVTARVRCRGRTGVEMEALTAASVALLTLYDMVKAVDKSMVIEGVRLLEKRGGSGGTYVAADAGSSA